jgi:ubiquinone/menaquinone biosynthesis C-methylase UbiE
MNKVNTYGKLCAEFYDACKKFASLQEVNFYEKFIKKGGKTLEAMSGSGRLQIPLILNGHEVHGVDSSKTMLENCRQRANQLGVKAVLFEQSLSSMLLPHTYNTVTIAVGSFQLITDKNEALAALKNLRAHMVTSGNLLIDFFVPETSNTAASTRETILDEKTKIRLTTRYKFDIDNRLAYGFCEYEKLIDNVVHEKEEETIKICWYQDEELENLLIKAGFKITKLYQERLRGSTDSEIIHAQAK